MLDGEPLTCERIKVAVERAFTEHGVAAEEFIVSHGPQTAVGHEMGHGPIAPGEPSCLDLFPRDRETRLLRRHDADVRRRRAARGAPRVPAALPRGAAERPSTAIRPGVRGLELHTLDLRLLRASTATRRSSRSSPARCSQDGFFHALGHGVGLEVHEQPWLGRAPGELVAGDVVAIEPGLYRSGCGGCRLEDLVLVTEDGGELLTDFPYDLAP